VPQLQADGVQRQEPQAQAGHHRLLDGLVALQLDLQPRLDMAGLKKHLHRRTGA
jgi:hypothetical protein